MALSDKDAVIPTSPVNSSPFQKELEFDPVFTTFRKKEMTVKLEWKDIEYSVGGSGNKKKVILKKICGEANPGEVVAIMGPSGAGKTTLLNVLAGRITGGHGGKALSGSLLANGETIKPTSFRTKVAYVTQEDAIFPTATTRESLDFSARLRLPSDMPKADRDKIVEDILVSLGLKKVENTMVGSELIRGLSGGEKKRVAIGVELVSNPTCLFLDEPTSGLDSWSAWNVVKILKAISGTGCTILCSIHQPSSEVFNSFDSLVLLGQGHVIYQGRIADVDVPFTELGFGVPPRTNVADHVMLLTQTMDLEKLPRDDQNMRRYGGQLPPVTVPHDEEAKGKNALQKFASSVANFGGMSVRGNSEKPNGFTQAGLLAVREFKSIYRDKASLIARFGGTAFLNILFAIIFLGAGDQNKAGYTPQSHFGALTQIVIGALFGAAQPALLLFPLERIIFIREKATGTYGTIPYVFAKLLVELPVAYVTALITMIVSYWTIGFNGNFFYLSLCIWGLMMAATSTAYVMGSIVSSPKAAQELAPIVLVPQILFLGFFIKIEQMPVWISWAQYLCSAKYGLNLALLVELDPALAKNEVIKLQWESILSGNAVYYSETWFYALLLAAIFAGFRILSLIILARRARFD